MAIDLIRNLVKCFHNPQVMLQVPQRSYKIEPGLLTDHCGLKVPQHSTAWTFATRASANRCSVLSLRGSGNGKSSCHVWSVEGHGGLQSCHAILTQSCWPGQLKVLEMSLSRGSHQLFVYWPGIFVTFSTRLFCGLNCLVSDAHLGVRFLELWVSMFTMFPIP